MLFKFMHHQPPAVEDVTARLLYEAKIDLLAAEDDLESALARAEALRNRVKRLTTQQKESGNVARIAK